MHTPLHHAPLHHALLHHQDRAGLAPRTSKGAPLPPSPNISRRALAALAALALLAAACSSGGGKSATDVAVSASHTLKLAFGADMQVPDPDIFYEIEGNAVVTSVYEGLVKYANGTTQIVPALAQSWTISPDGLTYTFKLRPNVTFHDGTPVNSAAAKFSFQRRAGVNSAPAYMVADVVGMDAPDPLTFVVHLDKPVSAFMDYLAAPYSPKLVSPTAVTAHETGGNPGDWAQGWLKTNDAGTGPYTISQFVPGSHYVLSSYTGYWGTKPYYSAVTITIVPDASTQQVELQNGQLSMIMHGLPVNAVDSFKSNPNFVVKEFPAQLKAMLYVNPNKGVFASAALRQALRSAINKKAIVSSVYGNTLATVSTQAFPVGEFPAGQAADNPAYDPSKLTSAVHALTGSKTVRLAYSTDDPTNQRVAEFVQSELSAVGLSVTIQGVPIGQVFNYASTPPDQLPDLLVWTVNPDDSHPDSWIRIFSNTNGSLNELHGSVPQADTLMDAGLHATDPATIQQDYAQAGVLVAGSGEWISIADVKDTVVSHAGVTGWYFQLPTADTVVLGNLAFSGGSGG
jgi:peptide/nickel transport system substrate-binding protein